MVLHISVCGANTLLNGAIIAAFIVVSVHIAKAFMALQLLIFFLKEHAGCKSKAGEKQTS
jgi:hypothetical protein